MKNVMDDYSDILGDDRDFNQEGLNNPEDRSYINDEHDYGYYSEYDDTQLQREYLDSETFSSVSGRGREAPAYKNSISNIAILKLWDDEGLSCREIARQLHCSPSTVKNRLNKMGLSTKKRRRFRGK